MVMVWERTEAHGGVCSRWRLNLLGPIVVAMHPAIERLVTAGLDYNHHHTNLRLGRPSHSTSLISKK